MDAEINYWWTALIVILSILLIIWVIRRNMKDAKKYEKQIIKSELKPDKHEGDKKIKP